MQLRYRIEKPVGEMLKIWPAIPIAVSGISFEDDVDDIIAALEQRDRVREIDVEGYSSYSVETIVESMLVPFPALKRLFLAACDVTVPDIPDTFLGGFAPRLQSLGLYNIPFPALPKLLLSASGLVDLTLSGIPRAGTFLPETIANYISNLSRLETFCLEFSSRRPCPVPRSHSPPVARAVFPALYRLKFKGAAGYLDSLISHIDAPVIYFLDMTFFNQPFVTSDFCQLRQFIGRAEMFKSLTHAHINFGFCTVELSLVQRTQKYNTQLSVGIRCEQLHQRLQSLAEVGSASLLPLSKVESLELSSELLTLQLLEDHTEEDSRWLNVLQPFSGVQSLYACESTLPSFAYAVKEVPEDRLSEVLPALQELSMDEFHAPGPVDEPSPPAIQEAIERFIAMRHLYTTIVKQNY